MKSKLVLTKINSFFVSIIILCQQLGVSILFSIGTVGLLLLLSSSKYKILKKDVNIYLLLFGGIFVSVISYLIKYDESNIYILQDIRLLVLLFICIIALKVKDGVKLNIDLLTVVFGCSLLIFSFVIIQYISTLTGYNLILPYSFYAIDDGALASKWLERSIELGYTFISRPSAFFSEPSYLGMITCSLYYLTLFLQKNKIRTISRLLLIGSTLLSSTMLGIIGLLLLIFYDKIKFQWIVLLLITGGYLYFTFGEHIISARFLDILNKKDTSMLTRFVAPFSMIYYNFYNGDILGIPFSATISYYRDLGFYEIDDDPPFHNSFLNIIINYGLLGLYIIYMFFVVLLKDNRERILLFIIMCQNGSLFDYIKVFNLLFFILISRYIEADIKRYKIKELKIKMLQVLN